MIIAIRPAQNTRRLIRPVFRAGALQERAVQTVPDPSENAGLRPLDGRDSVVIRGAYGSGVYSPGSPEYDNAVRMGHVMPLNSGVNGHNGYNGSVPVLGSRVDIVA